MFSSCVMATEADSAEALPNQLAEMGLSDASDSECEECGVDDRDNYHCGHCHNSFESDDNRLANLVDATLSVDNIVEFIDENVAVDEHEHDRYGHLTFVLSTNVACPICETEDALYLRVECSTDVSIDGESGQVRTWELESWEFGVVEASTDEDWEVEFDEDSDSESSADDSSSEEEDPQEAGKQDIRDALLESGLRADSLTDDEITAHAAFWTSIEEDTDLVIAQEDKYLYLGPAQQNREKLSKYIKLLQLQEISGCWHRHNVYEKSYRLIMEAREAWFQLPSDLTQAQQRERIFAHPGLPAMRDPSHSRSMVRHHPFRCELFHRHQTHQQCNRPSHLAFGSKAWNKAADEQARNAIMREMIKMQFAMDVGTPRSLEHLDDFADQRFANRHAVLAVPYQHHADPTHKLSQRRIFLQAAALMMAAITKMHAILPEVKHTTKVAIDAMGPD